MYKCILMIFFAKKEELKRKINFHFSRMNENQYIMTYYIKLLINVCICNFYNI